MESPLANSRPPTTATVPKATTGWMLSPVKAMAKMAAKGACDDTNRLAREAPIKLTDRKF